MPKLSIVIPVYNEKRTIKEILEKVEKTNLPVGWQKEIIIVDDGSDDGTKEILKSYQKKFKIIFKSKNQGKGSALKEGFKFATGDYILIQDADLEYNPENYQKLLTPIIKKEAEIVFGKRIFSFRNFNNFLFWGGLVISKIFNLFFSVNLSDIAVCYKIFPRKLVPQLINLPSNDFVYDVIELTYAFIRSGLPIKQVEIDYFPRSKREGKKIKFIHGIKCFFAILKLKYKELWGK